MMDDEQYAGVHLVLGPVGAGKTTWARAEADRRGAVRFDLDDWMVRLFRPDRPDEGDRLAWYVERAGRCVDQIWDVALAITARGTPVILELGLVRRASTPPNAPGETASRAGGPHRIGWPALDL